MDIPAILTAIRKAANVKQTGLGKLIGVSQPQISRYMKGSEPKSPAYNKIIEAARKHGVLDTDVRSEDVAASLDAPPPLRRVKIKGYVGAGAKAHFYAVSDEDYEEVEAPVGASDKTVAVEIKGSSFGPLLNTWLVFYDDVRSPVTEDLIGEVCVVGLADDRILIKEIRRDRRGYRLLSNNPAEPPIENVRIEWAAKVTDMRPRRR